MNTKNKFTRVEILMLVIILGAVVFLIHYYSSKEELPQWSPPKVEKSVLADRVNGDYQRAIAVRDKLQTMQLRIDMYQSIPPYLWEC